MTKAGEDKQIKFSILLITHNQEKYVEETISSILAQTYKNFEIVVSDDCSSDKTLEVVRKINSDKIKIVQTPYNMGINGNLNTAIQNSSGDYVMFLGGDDKLRAGYLEKMNEILGKEDVAVFYSKATVINPKSEYTIGKDKSFYDLPNAPREKILHKMFMETNMLPSPGMTIKKDVISKILPLNNSLIVYQDFNINIELLADRNNKYVFLDDIYVEYRKFDDGRNISNNNGGMTIVRNMLDTDCLMDTFLKIRDLSLLREVFPEEIAKTGIEPYEDTIPFFLGQMALLSPNKNRRVWGYKTVAKFISTDEGYGIAHERYGFIFKDFLGLAQKVSGIDSADFYGKYLRYKKLFNMTIGVSGIVIALLIGFIVCISFLH
jgi:Glycosyltransferases involved in cell wall biogenesis